VDKKRFVGALSGLVGETLASDLIDQLMTIRQDCVTRTLGRTAPGKFVEIFVQCLQYIDQDTYESKPNVDEYLTKRVENTSLPEGLRVCAARAARVMYTLRNKRSIAHNNEVDMNSCDLALLHSLAVWIVAELLRHATGLTMQECGSLIETLYTPAGTIVEEIDGTCLVHADVSVRTELLILLYRYYPDLVPVDSMLKSLSRRNRRTVRNRLGDLHAEKLVHGDAKSGYRLTQIGYAAAVNEIKALA